MAIREIVSLPDPALRRKAHKVTNFDKDLQVLIEDMVETMRQAPGVGLAAPQIAISTRLIVVEYGDDPRSVRGDENEDAPKKLYVMANPEIVLASPELVSGTEGCLSVPGLIGDVERHQGILLKGMNRRGKLVKLKAEGWLARVFQHEIDHLDGVLFTDRATRVWKPTPEEAAIAND
jgi:peptide deformylase